MPDGSQGGTHKDGAAVDHGLTAYPIRFAGPSLYPKEFEGTGYALVFEDDKEAGYLHVMTGDFEEVLDSLGLYSCGTPESLTEGESAYFIWNRERKKAGMFFHGEYQAVVDFQHSAACCRSGYPPAEPSGWCSSPHTWDPRMLSGLTFNRLEGE